MKIEKFEDRITFMTEKYAASFMKSILDYVPSTLYDQGLIKISVDHTKKVISIIYDGSLRGSKKIRELRSWINDYLESAQ